MNQKLDRADIHKAISNAQLARALYGERALVLGALVAALVTAGTLVYQALDRDRLEVVYFEQERMDAPTLMRKVRDGDDAVKADRWVRGFVRRFIAYFFISPDDSTEFARKAVGWLHAHTGSGGQSRSESIMEAFADWDKLRRDKWASFYAVNDPAALKIRQSDEDARLIFIEQPGTYVTRTREGEAFHDAKLKLVLQKTAVSGIESGFGAINVTGLIVLNGTIEYVPDYTRPQEVAKHPVFEDVE